MATEQVVRSQVVDFGALEFKEFLPGLLAKRVWADEASNRMALLLRFGPGSELNRNVHNGDELVFVLEGSVEDEFGAVTAGNVGYRPPGCTHTVRSPKGATAFAVITGGVAPVASEVAAGPPSQVFDLANMPWEDTRPGLRQKRFWADGAANRSVSCNRFEPGAGLPPHRHVGDELVFVIEGSIADEAGALRPGVLGYRPNGCAHTVTSANGATVLAFLWGGVEPL